MTAQSPTEARSHSNGGGRLAPGIKNNQQKQVTDMEVLVVKDLGDTQLDVHHLLEMLANSAKFPKEAEFIAIGSGCRYESLLEFCLSLVGSRVRSLNRRLLIDESDIGVVLQLLLQARRKELYKDPEVVVSDVLELVAKVDKKRQDGEFPKITEEDCQDAVELASADYKPYMDRCNMFDPWTVLAETRALVESSWSPERHRCLVVMQHTSQMDRHLGDVLSSGAEQRALQLEVDVTGRLTSVRVEETREVAVPRLANRKNLPALTLLVSYLRILANSRDELALARVITGPGYGLTDTQFSFVRHQADKNMSMYQSIVSYIHRTNLGGKSYAPGEDHPFTQYQKTLADFVSFMEKLQSELEEAAKPRQGISKVMGQVRHWLQKNGETDAQTAHELLEGALTEADCRLADTTTTPRAVGCGGSLAGRPALKLLREVLDTAACRWGSRRLAHLPNMGTPDVRQTGLVGLFKTPQAASQDAQQALDEFDVDNTSLGERLGQTDSPAAAAPPTACRYVRYKSHLGWAGGHSPVSCPSRGKIRTRGVTLVAAASPDTPAAAQKEVADILREVRNSRQELDDTQEEGDKKKTKKKVRATKRSLQQDVENEVRQKFGLSELEPKRKKQEAEKNSSTKSKKKSVQVLPPGQKTLLAFFKK